VRISDAAHFVDLFLFFVYILDDTRSYMATNATSASFLDKTLPYCAGLARIASTENVSYKLT
jgi:hypothetical protein